MPEKESNMKTLFESLLRLYEFDGAPATVPSAKAQEASVERVADLSAKDSSTFPYLP
jgi:hypothetical protein